MDDPFAELQLPESRVLIIITGMLGHVLSLRVTTHATQVVQYACENLQTV
jgi:hypothetical protein